MEVIIHAGGLETANADGPLRAVHITASASKLPTAAAARANQARALVKAGQFQAALGLFQQLEAEGALDGSCSLWLARSCALQGSGDSAACAKALSAAEAYCQSPQVKQLSGYVLSPMISEASYK